MAIFLANIKSLALPNHNECTIHKSVMAKNGIVNTAVRFKLKRKPVIKAATIIDHQGKNCDKIAAKNMVAIKLMIFFFISLALKFVSQ